MSTINWGYLSYTNGIKRAIALSADKHGLRHGMSAQKPHHVVVEANGRRVTFGGGSCSLDDASQRRLSRYKQEVRTLIEGLGANATKGQRFDSRSGQEEARQYADEIGYPVIVKPEAGTTGKGVVKIAQAAEFPEQWRQLASACEKILVEQFFEADEYRFTCVEGRAVAILKRKPANVMGDGVSTIDELIAAKNVLRKAHHALRNLPIPVDDVVRDKLASQGLGLDSVPGQGVEVFLRDNSNVSTGGEAIDYTDEMHPGYTERVNRVASEFSGLVFSGIDVLIKDHRAVPDDRNWAIIEVNHSPGFSSHHSPWSGTERDVAGVALQRIFSLPEKRDEVPAVRMAIRIEGPGIQDVGYRRWLKRTANGMRVDGWVRNAADGAIDAVLAGDYRWVGELIALCQQGPARATVSRISLEGYAGDPGQGFRILAPREHKAVAGR